MNINDTLKVIGLKIRAARMEADMTASFLATRVGVSRDTIRNVESGKGNVSIATYLSIQTHLSIKDMFPNEPATN